MYKEQSKAPLVQIGGNKLTTERLLNLSFNDHIQILHLFYRQAFIFSKVADLSVFSNTLTLS